MAEISSESRFLSGNIANMIPEGSLNKMVPLTGDHGGCGVCVCVCVWGGGGGGGGARGPPLAHGLYRLGVCYSLSMP